VVAYQQYHMTSACNIIASPNDIHDQQNKEISSACCIFTLVTVTQYLILLGCCDIALHYGDRDVVNFKHLGTSVFVRSDVMMHSGPGALTDDTYELRD
jgi:hypothetical protein